MFLTNRLTTIDTSRIWPFTTRNTFNSRLNLMQALAVRNLVLHLKEHDRISHLTSLVFVQSGDGQPKSWNVVHLLNQKTRAVSNAVDGVF